MANPEPPTPLDADIVGSGGGLAQLAAATRHALRSQPTTAAAQLSAEQTQRVLAAVEASTADNTKAAYRFDWTRFAAWCTQGGHAALPADPLVVAAYVTEAAAQRTMWGGVGLCPVVADAVGVFDQPVPHRRDPRPAWPQ